VIVGTALIAATGMLGVGLTDQWLKANVAYRTDSVNPYTLPGGVIYGTMSRGADGLVVSDEVALSMAPPGVDPFMWVSQNYENVYATVPASEYPRYVLIESGALGIVIVLGGLAAFAVVERRRPL
jgi:hypothetical protein